MVNNADRSDKIEASIAGAGPLCQPETHSASPPTPAFALSLADRFGSTQRVAVTGSTNDDLLGAGFASSPASPALLWADHQTRGRGRRGRRWMDQTGRSLTFSIAFERCYAAAEPPPASFSLVAAVAIIGAISKHLPVLGRRLRVKWPNDILLDGGKLAGILSEVRRQGSIERLVIGCGVNLQVPDVPAPILANAASAIVPAAVVSNSQDWSDAASDRLVGSIALALLNAYDEYCAYGFTPFRECWLALDAFAGESVRLLDDERELAIGTGRGVDSNGALQVEHEGVIRRYSIGELSARAALPRTSS